MRKPRAGEWVCRCGAYRFPHRFGGGRCNGYAVVDEAWHANYGGGACAGCDLHEDGACQVVNGRDSPKVCPVFIDFVAEYEIKC